MTAKKILCLDVGERRIGVAVADTSVRIAVAQSTIEVDGSELNKIVKLIWLEGAILLVAGYPRNQQGEATRQTEFVENFIKQLQARDDFDTPVAFQDESLTSVLAEQRLVAQGKPYTKADIDAHAAQIILQDYIEEHYG